MKASSDEPQDKRDERNASRPDSDPGDHRERAAREPDIAAPDVIVTTDRVVVAGEEHEAEWRAHPDSTVVVETNRVREPAAGRVAGVVIVPYTEAGPDRATDDENRHDQENGAKGRGDNQPSDHRRERADREEDDKPDRPAPPETVRPLWQILLFAGLVALGCGMLGALGYSYFFGTSKSDDDSSSNRSSKSNQSSSSDQKGSDSKSGDKSDSQAQTGKEIPGFTRAADADTLRNQIEHLSERIDRLSQPRNETPPDVRTLQIKVGELSHSVEDMGDLPARLRRLEDRLEDFSQRLKTLRAQAQRSYESPAGTQPSSMPAGRTTATVKPLVRAVSDAFTPSDSPDSSLTQAVALFREGNYREARNILQKLQVTRPDDARVWYFAALTQGLVAGQWGKETRNLVAKGIDRERSGQPSAQAINLALAGLTPAQGRDWLAALRKQAEPRR